MRDRLPWNFAGQLRLDPEFQSGDTRKLTLPTPEQAAWNYFQSKYLNETFEERFARELREWACRVLQLFCDIPGSR